MKPNLFNLATKELTQDAFIAWLMQWSSPDCLQYNPQLVAVASQFVRELISRQADAPESITAAKVGRQWKNIDVWAEINNKYLVIIEDKTGSGEHSDQLTRYKKICEAWYKGKGYTIICIYLKTQTDSAATLKRVKDQGFAIFGRRHFLELLEVHRVESDIYNDFKDRLRQIEDEESQFQSKKIKDWNGPDWKGFYQQLDVAGRLVNWNYVNNPRGGFWNAVLNWFEFEGHNPYMQIEEGLLCFKVGEVYEDHRTARDRIHYLLMQDASKPAALQRPSRFRPGTYMTCAVISRSEWLGGDDEIINMAAVVERLNGYEGWFKEALARAEQVMEGKI